MEDNYLLTFEERDEFKRKKISEKLIKLIKNEGTVSRIVIDGPWGSGKTEFCHKFINMVGKDDDNLKCLYIDTYRYDHTEDPLMMLLTGISSITESEKLKKSLYEKSVPVLKILGKVALQIGSRVLLNTKMEDFDAGLSDVTLDGSDSIIDFGVNEAFKNFERADENLEQLKKVLGEITKDKFLVIVLDELDRCRPSFGLSLLEKIKHVFDVPGIKFIFSTNLKHLESIVIKEYGIEKNDSVKYLSKFFHFTIILPTEFPGNFSSLKNNSCFHLRALIKMDEKLDAFFSSNMHSYLLLDSFIKKDRLSLRDIEMFVRYLKILNALDGECTINVSSGWTFGNCHLISVYIYLFHKDLSESLRDLSPTPEMISHFFGLNEADVNSSPNPESVEVFYCIFMYVFFYKIENDQGAGAGIRDLYLKRLRLYSNYDGKDLIKAIRELQLLY